ncbi:MAG: hypothetical protein IPI04_12265 [Ignavibacteria bacterium]|nr:hypothetical protein [Ignavibacteria bacterium]MBK9405127.1 hypothetical protein [Ignavibacteria bacterium]MBL0106807.1 hypothetical protein [Ignavibacteria bacterium]
MEDFITRFFDNLGLKTEGPMKFRFILQPIVSLIFAVKAGLRDSKSGEVPYFWGLVSGKGERKDLLKEGWKDVGKLFVIALLLDIIAQIIILKTVYPFEAVITAIILAFIPYIIFRGIVNRIISLFKKK